MKFIEPLSDCQVRVLKSIIKSSLKYRTRLRAHAVILSSRKFAIDDLAAIFDVHRETISRWLDEWEDKGFYGLYDSSKSFDFDFYSDFNGDDINSLESA